MNQKNETETDKLDSAAEVFTVEQAFEQLANRERDGENTNGFDCDPDDFCDALHLFPVDLAAMRTLGAEVRRLRDLALNYGTHLLVSQRDAARAEAMKLRVDVARLNKENDDWHEASKQLRADVARAEAIAQNNAAEVTRLGAELAETKHLLAEERALTAATVKPAFRYTDLSAFKPSPEFESAIKKAMDLFHAWRCPTCGAPGHIHFDASGHDGFFLEMDKAPPKPSIVCSKGCAQESPKP